MGKVEEEGLRNSCKLKFCEIFCSKFLSKLSSSGCQLRKVLLPTNRRSQKCHESAINSHRNLLQNRESQRNNWFWWRSRDREARRCLQTRQSRSEKWRRLLRRTHRFRTNDQDEHGRLLHVQRTQLWDSPEIASNCLWTSASKLRVSSIGNHSIGHQLSFGMVTQVHKKIREFHRWKYIENPSQLIRRSHCNCSTICRTISTQAVSETLNEHLVVRGFARTSDDSYMNQKDQN